MGTADDFEAWYRSERTALLRFAFLLCGGDRHTAEDAVADAVARCWPKIRRGRVDDSGAYVRRAVARRVIDGGRRRQVAAKHQETLEGEAGRAAVRELLARAHRAGLLPRPVEPEFETAD